MKFLILASLPLTTTSLMTPSLRRTARTTPLHESLVPEENPTAADPNAVSASGILYASVTKALDTKLYPLEDLEKRNAASRTDGYWKYIQKGQDPPQHLTYGEFDATFFAQMLDRVLLEYLPNQENWNDKVFTDIGSGTGRLVLAAAALHPGWKICRGIELLESIHVVAEASLEKCRDGGGQEEHGEEVSSSATNKISSMQSEDEWRGQFDGQFVIGGDDEEEVIEDEQLDETTEELEMVAEDHPEEAEELSPVYYLPSDVDGDNEEKVKLAPIDFVCGSFEDQHFGDSDLVFCFSSCMSPSILGGLSKSIGRQCKPGTIVITTEFPLHLEGIIDPRFDDDDHKDTHCDYDGDFDDPDDDEAWMQFCEDEGIQATPFKFELLESIDGYCWLTGGVSTCHVHKVVTSAWQKDFVPESTEESKEEKAAMAWMHSLKHREDKGFYRDVRNNFIFHGFSESWYKDLPIDDNSNDVQGWP